MLADWGLTRCARLLSGSLLCVLPQLATAQGRPDTLTGRVHTLAEVTVAAERTSRYALGTTRYALDSAALSQFRGATLAEALAARTPIYFKNYGPGQLASVSIRGTTARHTAVLWNGFNINFSSLGEADFSLLPVGGNTQVQVQAGPGSALYGTGAVGGAVLLSGQPAFGGGLRGSVQADAGSFELGAGTAEASYGTARVAVRTTALYRTAQNDFPLPESYTGTPGLRQQNAAFNQWNVTQDVRLRIGEGGQLTAAAWLSRADRQIQAVLGLANRHGRELDRSTRLLTEYRQQLGRYEGLVRVAYVQDGIRYGDDTLEPQDSDLRTTQAQTEHTLTFGPRASLRLGAEAQHFAATVEGYASPITENRFAAFGLLRYDPRPELRFNLNVRQAAVPNQQPPLAPAAGLEWDLYRRAAPLAGQNPVRLLTLKASAARSYRAATLNERYWPTGNPNILPETGWGYEAGLQYEADLTRRWHWRTELTAYRQLVDNWVQWVPTAIGFSPLNLRLVRTQGLEVATSLQRQQGTWQTAFRATYAFTQARKQQGYAADAEPIGNQLAYVPLHAATASAEATWRGHWLLNATANASSYRYTTPGAADFLPAYLLVQAGAGRHFDQGPARFTLLVQGYNLTNARYQTYLNHAMPPRSFMLSLRVAKR
ncbi:TonB-dependent receptor [Hymenobacter terrigena]